MILDCKGRNNCYLAVYLRCIAINRGNMVQLLYSLILLDLSSQLESCFLFTAKPHMFLFAQCPHVLSLALLPPGNHLTNNAGLANTFCSLMSCTVH